MLSAKCSKWTHNVVSSIEISVHIATIRHENQNGPPFTTSASQNRESHVQCAFEIVTSPSCSWKRRTRPDWLLLKAYICAVGMCNHGNHIDAMANICAVVMCNHGTSSLLPPSHSLLRPSLDHHRLRPAHDERKRHRRRVLTIARSKHHSILPWSAHNRPAVRIRAMQRRR